MLRPGHYRGMKLSPMSLLLVVCALLTGGCARFYNITTNSGRVVTSRGKPHYDRENSVIVFTDVRGERRTLPAGSVSQIAPASDTSNPQTFNVKPAR
jgi:hypothetical protein